MQTIQASMVGLPSTLRQARLVSRCTVSMRTIMTHPHLEARIFAPQGIEEPNLGGTGDPPLRGQPGLR
jgi:hypothetical protein